VTVAVAPNAKMPKNGPPGRSRSASVTTDPTVANAVTPRTMSSGSTRCTENAVPSAAPVTSIPAPWNWCRARSSGASSRPYMPVKEPKAAWSISSG